MNTKYYLGTHPTANYVLITQHGNCGAVEVAPRMISVTVITNGGQLAGNKFSEVLAVWRDIADRSVTIETKDLMMLQCDPMRLERFAATAEQKSIAQAKALEYQASLTKAGTARLRSK